MDLLERIAKAQGVSVEKVKQQLKREQQLELEAEIRGEKITLQKSKEKEETQTQLPMWGEKIRGVPNSVLRSALFTATKRGKRAYFEGVQIASVGSVKVIFTGPRLDQADLDVWEQCLHIARTTTLGTKINFTANSFLKAIGRNGSGANHEWLKGSLRRLSTSLVELADGKKAYWGTLISHGQRNDETGFYELELNPKIASLYDDASWTGVDWQQRKALQGKPLALWLHGFYSTHEKPFDYKIETLHNLCGSETKELKEFKKSLVQSLTHLNEATGWLCTIKDDKLTVIKSLEQALKRLPNGMA